jgi:putative transcriptional regulator
VDEKTFAGLLEATQEALAHYRGEKLDLRTTELPEPPEPMSNEDIRSLRKKLKVSQAVFARYLNVSTKLVQAWESGFRRAEGAALRLLRLAEQVPMLFTPVGNDAAMQRREQGSKAKVTRVYRPTRKKLAR